MSRSTKAVAVALVVAAAIALSALAAPGPRLSLLQAPRKPEAGAPTAVVVAAAAAGRAGVSVWIARGRASRAFAAQRISAARYRARVVFPTPGRWRFGARAGRRRVSFGSVRVHAQPVPLTFAWPTSVDVISGRSLLLAENGSGRVLGIDAVTGKTTVVASVARAYSIAHAPNGTVYVSAGPQLLRLDADGKTTTVSAAGADIGPVAVAANGDVYYATDTQAFRLAGGAGTPTPIASGLSGPHGIAVTNDGAVLVSDTGHQRVVRIDPSTSQLETWTQLGAPRGIAVAADGSVYVVDAASHKVVHFLADGRLIAPLRPTFADPYDVAAAGDGSLYVVDTAAIGSLYRIGADGTSSVVARTR